MMCSKTSQRLILRAQRLAALGTAVALGSTSGLAAADTVNSEQRALTVEYRDGGTERYLVAWSADVNMSVGEDGGPAKPLEGHFVDDRHCHWSITGSITRQVVLISHTGQAYASVSLARVYNRAQANEGASFMLMGLRAENCNDAAARRNSDYEDMKRRVLADLTVTVASDFTNVKEELKRNAEVVKVSSGVAR